MKVYARVVDGVVFEVIQPATNEDGLEIAIDERFGAEFVDQMVDVTGLDPQPACWWGFDGEHFTAPQAYQPTIEEIVASNTSTRDVLLGNAAMAIAPLQDAVDLDDATEVEIALLTKWKQYRVGVNRIDLRQASPAWPAIP